MVKTMDKKEAFKIYALTVAMLIVVSLIYNY